MLMVSSGLSMEGSGSRRAPGLAESGTEPGLVKPGHGGGCDTMEGGKKTVPKAISPPKDPPPGLACRWGSEEDVGDGSCGILCCVSLLRAAPQLSSELCFPRPAWPPWGVQGDGWKGGTLKVCCGGPAFTAS